MNTRKLLVSISILIGVFFSACAPHSPDIVPVGYVLTGTATPPALTIVPSTIVPPTVAPTIALPINTATPAQSASDPKALALIAGNYTYKDGKEFQFKIFSNERFINLTSSNDQILGLGVISVTKDQITFIGYSVSCPRQPGVYKWSLDNTVLHLTPIKDDCKRRVGIFGTQAFEKMPENNTDATVIWEIPATVNGIATDLLGNVYVTDGGANFSKYDANGKLLGSWSGGLTYTTGIAVDGQGNIYVANFEPPVIHKFTPDGNPLLAWPIADGTGPVGLAIDLQGNVYVALHRLHDHYVEKYDPQGKLLGTWAKPDTTGGQIKAGPFTGPGFMAIDANGDNYISDNQQVHKYDRDGKFLYSISERSSMAIDGQGNLYLFASSDNTLLKFDSNGKQIRKWAISIPGINTGKTYFYGIAMGKDVNIFLYSGNVLAKIKLPAQ
jgi:hypothetical protein